MEKYAFNNIEPVYKDRDIQFDSYYKYMKMIYELDRPILTKDQERELFERIYCGAQDARNILIESNLRLVIDIAKGLSNSFDELIDNIQNGNIGLIKSIDRYNLDRGVKFSTYAYYWIKKEIIYLGYKEKKIIALPYEFKEKYRKYSKAKIELQYRLKRKPTIEEMALFLGVDIEYIINIRKYFEYCDICSLDCTCGEDNEYVFYDFVADAKGTLVEDNVINELLSNELEVILKKAKLNEQEIEVLKYRCGYYNNRVYTFNEIGELFGVTRERIRQIEVKALYKIRDKKKNLISLGSYLYDSDKKIEEMADILLKENSVIKAKNKEKDKVKNANYRARKMQNK